MFTGKRKNEMTLLKIRSTLFRFAVILSASSLEKSDRLRVKSTFTVMATETSRNLHATDLYVPIEPKQWPIVYTNQYNINAFGMQKLHPFDAGKWGRVFQMLKEAGMLSETDVVTPKEATSQDLLVVHTQKYLDNLTWSSVVARITEVLPVALVPNFILQKILLKPLRFQTGGTILATKLAVEKGWAINIGGGFHHAHGEDGGGFCVYADITLAIKFLMASDPKIKKAMIIDLDAHQGNGHERDFLNDDSVYILDVYNGAIYPRDSTAKAAIKKRANCLHHTKDEEYLEKVNSTIDEALNEFEPDIIVYNAGTDILKGDPLGNLDITAEGIIKRDEIVFSKVRAKKIPIVMVTSGGYTMETAKIIADSILNLKDKKIISRESDNSIKHTFPPKGNKESEHLELHADTTKKTHSEL
ncbi:histone deacetylase 11 [Mytilus galloprovincialis]|uniref:Histone deacetylase 11 n=1 Tax=Mytilus galloprovincialis TaxID=29158 RepID=A0A8B6DN37_MYTGA|nr:histone deacetylase 11 [Mytilus galloprovincialis]